jgi:hypothetical protein
MKVLKSIHLPTISYGCEAWSLAQMEEHRLRVLENRVLRRIFGPKGEGVVGSWRRLHIEELHNLYTSPDIVPMIKSRMMIWVWQVARMGELISACKILVTKQREEKDLGVDDKKILELILGK